MIEQYRNNFKQLAPHLPGSAEVARMRHQALEKFAANGLPGPRDEQWKYTRLTALEKHFFTPVKHLPVHSITAAQLAPYFLTDNQAYRLVFIDGHYAPALSRIMQGLPKNAQLLSLQTALQNPALPLSAWINTCITTGASPVYSAMQALNTCFMSDGAYLFLPADTQLEQPLELIFINTTADTASYLRNIIVLEKNAAATIIENHINLQSEKNFTNKCSEIFVQEQARLDHFLIVNESPQTIHTGNIHLQQQAHSQVNSYAIALNGGLIRNDIQVNLSNAAGCQLKGLYLANARQHIDFHTRIDHLQPEAKSYEHYKGIICDRARAVFNGKIMVHPDAQKTDARLNNENLLLSRHAEIDTKPELEIYADDVKCSHGATVGQLDETSLFYLRSRGIDEAAAKRILTYAFAEEIINELDNTELRKKLCALLIAHFFQGEALPDLL